MSVKMLEHLLEANNIDLDAFCADTSGVSGERSIFRRVSDLITSGETGHNGGAEPKGYLKEIVANGRNNVDVDKFDYIQRDCLNCGLTTNSCNFERLQLHMKVVDDEICFRDTEVHNLYELFHTRASLFQRVYTHPKVKAIEFMVADVLFEADKALKENGDVAYHEKIDEPKDFAKLDDTLLRHIEYSTDVILEKAQELLRRLRRRELYRYINECIVPANRADLVVKPEDIVSHQNKGGNNGVELRPEHIVVQDLQIDWSLKNGDNPVDKINFYHEYEPGWGKFPISKERVSSFLPTAFVERKVRVYLKTPDDANNNYMKALDQAFQNYQHKTFGSVLQMNPASAKKPPRPSPESAAGDGGGVNRPTSRHAKGLFKD